MFPSQNKLTSLRRPGFALIVLTVILVLTPIGAAAEVVEDFQFITDLPNRGWYMQNNSVPVGTTGWFQGNQNVFPAQAGASNSYIAANFNNTTGANPISNWLIAPNVFFHNGDVIRFWTRSTVETSFPDRLELRLSTSGTSNNVGAGPQAVGDFTRLLLSINPDLVEGGYPFAWTQYTIVLSELPPQGVSGRVAFRYYVTDGGPMGANSNYIGIDSFWITSESLPVPPESPLDFDGDGKTDYVVGRNTGGGASNQITWFINPNGAAHTQINWGIASDIVVAGDFDGDDKADLTVYRPIVAGSVFYSLRSSNSTMAICSLGMPGDDPSIIGDYNGDDVDDFAVYRQGAPGQRSFWMYRSGTAPNGAINAIQWGHSGDTPAPGDYDGDSINDFCVRRENGSGQGEFALKTSAGGEETALWGRLSDTIVPGDYDGDGKDDFAVVRSNGSQLLWSVLGRNSNNIIYYGEPWGLSSDLPTPGDYDGDNKIDIAVWRPNVAGPQAYFYVRKSSDASLFALQWGQQGDVPLAKR